VEKPLCRLQEATVSSHVKTDPVVEQAEPAWDIAKLFPAQGQWSERDYFALETNRLVEFSHGHVEVLPMPTQTHQLIILFLLRSLLAYAEQSAPATVLPAGMRVRLWEGKYREPDVVFMLAEHAGRRHEQYWEGADLVGEVVSGDARDRERDLVHKRREYAQAGIPEYWIVDPETERITVLHLDRDRYVEHGVFTRGDTATSALLEGFHVSVSELLDVNE
jgi:Uma2 family endonuclease